MNQKEVVDTLLDQAKIEPGFTELVWQKLEEENREFFKAYYLRLMVKQQINEFNRLLDQQVQLMRQMQPTGVASLPTSNGSHISTLHQNSSCYAPEHTTVKAENIHHPISSGLTNAFTNGGSLLHPSMHTAVQMSAHSTRLDVPPNMLSAQSSNMGMIQGINGGMIKSETGYSGSSPYMFGSDGNVLEARQTIGDASVASFTSVESSSQPLAEQILDMDTSSFGFLGQIPRNFSLSDLTADFSQSSADILESYPRSPFLATDQDNRRLDSISEGGLSCEDFGSD
uniref:Angiotensin-converting enzyme 2 n=1 Tax=Fagus sylvatica TaxID=28930 RepID=A0A2N9HUR8_FAGSY